MQGIRNIIFDLGGVIINLDLHLTLDAFAQLSPNIGDMVYTRDVQHQLFHKFEEGDVSAAEFRQGIRDAVGKEIPDDKIDWAWNAMLLDIPKERLDRILQLKEQYRVFLFSNTNPIHLDAFIKILKREIGVDTLESYFHYCYYSHTLGMRKPRPEAFQYILDEQGLLPEETLFMDDTPGHLKGAQQVGIKTVHVSPENQMLEIVKDF